MILNGIKSFSFRYKQYLKSKGKFEPITKKYEPPSLKMPKNFENLNDEDEKSPNRSGVSTPSLVL